MSEHIQQAMNAFALGAPILNPILKSIGGWSGLTGALGTIDIADQEIPILGAITDGLTVAAGAGALIESAFGGGGDSDPAPAPPPALPQVVTQLGA